MAKFSFLSTSALVAACLAQPALAQTSPDPAAAEPTTAVPPAQAVGGEIIVTAQRRNERLRDVPATVTALSQESLQAANITNSLQLTQVTPGLQFAQLGAYSQPVLRGIGTQVSASGNATNVAIYIDGVYQATPLTGNFDFFGLDGVEVLKGPQGTLYGRNAAGGAILVTTRKPTYATHGEIQGSYGSYNERRANGYFSTGITSNLALSVTGQYRASDGYITNIFPTPHRAGGNEVWSGRAHLLFEPTSNATFQLIVDHTDSDDPVGMLSGTFKGNSFAIGKGLPIPYGQYEVALNTDPYFRFKTTGVTLRGEVDLGAFTVTSISGYRRTVSHQLIDADYTPAAIGNGGIVVALDGPQHQFSQEFMVSSNSTGPLRWTVGANVNDEADRQVNVVNGALSFDATTKTYNRSAFGELTYNLTDALSITGGARYSAETKHLTTANGAGYQSVAPVTFAAWTPRAVIKYAATPRTNVYASYSKGFKSGGFNPAGPTVIFQAFRPERINAYEAGIKSDEIRNVSFEAAGYLYDYNDIQFQTANPTPVPGAPLLTIVNAAKAKIYGAEFNTTVRPFEGLSAQFGIAYTHARYTSFPAAPITTPIPTGGNVTTFANGADKTLIRVPTWSGNAALNYKRGLGALGTLDMAGNVYFSSGYFGNVGNRLRQPSYQVVNTTVGLTLPGDQLRFSFWTKNLLNAKYDLQLYDPAQSDRHISAPPRTIGGTVEFKF